MRKPSQMKFEQPVLDTSSRLEARLRGADCENCPLKDRVPVLPTVNKKAKLIIVGQEPGAQEEDEGKPFVGKSGKLLNSALEDFDIDRRSECHVTNALLCRPGRKLSGKETRQAIVACRPRLHKELAQMKKSKFILALGKIALWSLTGRAKGFFAWLGAPQQGSYLKVQKKKELPLGETLSFEKYTVLPTFHPAFCLREPANTIVMQRHILRAWQLATGELTPWRWPKLYLEVNKQTIRALIRLLNTKRTIAFDIETQGLDARRDPVMCLSFSDGKTTVSLPWEEYDSGKYGYVKALWDYREDGAKCYELAKQILETKKLAAHNGPHDTTGMMVQYGIKIPLENYVFDTLPAHAILAPRLRHDLGFTAACEFHAPAWKAEFGVETDLKGTAKFVKRDQLVLRDYNAKDSLMTALVMNALRPQLKAMYKGNELFERRMATVRVAIRMSDIGVRVGQDRLERHRKNFSRKMNEARRLYEKVADECGFVHRGLDENGDIAEFYINPNAHRQNNKLFFETLGCNPRKWSEKTGAPSLDEDVVNAFVTHHDERVRVAARSLLKYRRWKKLLSTYVDNFRYVDVLHPEWAPWSARTGRWGCADGLQTIPKAKVEVVRGRKKVIHSGLRDLFIPRAGMALVEADYSQLELRIVALLAGAEKLIRMYNAGADVHQENANALFQREHASKQERRLAKTYAYAALYGASYVEIWKRLVVDFPDLSLGLVEMMHNRFFSLHIELKQWQQRSIREAYTNRYVESPLDGRRQYYPSGEVDPNEVLNFPAQSTGAFLIDDALVRIAKRIDWSRDCVLMQVHDALVFQSTDWKRLAKIIRPEMEKPVTLNGQSIAFPVDLQVSYTDWGHMCAEEDMYARKPKLKKGMTASKCPHCKHWHLEEAA